MTVLPLVATLVLNQSFVRTRTDDAQHCLRWPATAGARTALTFVQSARGDPAIGSAFFDAVTRSWQTWAAQMDACGSLTISEKTPRSTSRAIGYAEGGPNENLVLLRTQGCSAVAPPGDRCQADKTCGNTYDCWDHDAKTLALTTTTYVLATGVLVDSDTEINGANFLPTVVDSPPCAANALALGCVASDVQNTMTHEFGHALGLAHAPDPGSTMYATAPIGETSKRALDDGSKAFVCQVYAANAASQDCGPGLPDGGSGGGSRASGCSATGAGAPSGLLAALAALALGARRRTR